MMPLRRDDWVYGAFGHRPRLAGLRRLHRRPWRNRSACWTSTATGTEWLSASTLEVVWKSFVRLMVQVDSGEAAVLAPVDLGDRVAEGPTRELAHREPGKSRG